MMREVYIPPYHFNGRSFTLLAEVPLFEPLRAATVYWDRITMPRLPGIRQLQLDSITDLLEREGVATLYNLRKESSISVDDFPLFAQDFLFQTELSERRDQALRSILCPVGDRRTLENFFRLLLGEDENHR